MKLNNIAIALLGALSVTMAAAYADDQSASGTQSMNAATPAATNGPGQAATPAMPGNSTAQAKVKANRAKEAALRAAAAQKRADATANGALGEVNRPSVTTRPEISRPEIHR